MKIYTKTGDTGKTSLFGGTRVPKYNLRIESYGTLDELNSYLGLLRVQPQAQAYATILLNIQNQLFVTGAILATPPEKETLKNGQKRLKVALTEANITALETAIDAMEQTLPPMTHFILPGGNTLVSYCHIARCVCRRAERLVVQLYETEPEDQWVLAYLNRLSDYLFVLARKLTSDTQAEETPWIP